MATAIQMNLFGDILDIDNEIIPSQEVKNATQSLGTNGKTSLEEISSEPLLQPSGTRDLRAGAGESGEPSQRNDSGLDGERHAQERALEIVLPQHILLTPEKDHQPIEQE